jgi:hypothetical protein
MCWSASADLTVGSAIAAVGVASLAVVPKDRRMVLAALPLLLGAHQVIESLVWRGVDGTVGPGVASVARTAWVVIALPLLPAFIPLAVLLASGRPVPVRAWWFLAIGLATSAGSAYGVAAGGITAAQHGHTLSYGLRITGAPVLLVGYLISVLGPLLASGDPDLRLVGVATAIGAAVCALVWRLEFISTWCALAALISILMLHWSLRQRSRPPDFVG